MLIKYQYKDEKEQHKLPPFTDNDILRCIYYCKLTSLSYLSSYEIVIFQLKILLLYIYEDPLVFEPFVSKTFQTYIIDLRKYISATVYKFFKNFTVIKTYV